MLTKLRFSTLFNEFISILHSQVCLLSPVYKIKQTLPPLTSDSSLMNNLKVLSEEEMFTEYQMMILAEQMGQLKLGTNKCNYFSLSSQTS